jgi:hypothetical protein
MFTEMCYKSRVAVISEHCFTSLVCSTAVLRESSDLMIVIYFLIHLWRSFMSTP